jgi:signal transduction histidine kinase
MNSQRRWLSLAVVGAIGVGLSALSTYGSYLSPLCCDPGDTPIGRLPGLVQLLLWVGVMLVMMRREPSRLMWKLVLALLVAYTFGAASSIPNDVIWSLAVRVYWLPDAMTAHLALAFPSGRLSTTFDRRLITFIYAYLFASSALQAMVWDPHFTGAFRPRNVFLVWPNSDLAAAIGTATGYSVPLVALVVLWRLWRRWRVATPATRRVLGPLVVAMPLQGAVTVAWYVALAAGHPEVVGLLRGNPVFLLPYLILPAGFLVGALRGRFARASVADLAVELGRGVPLGGLEDLLRRRLRDRSLRLLFPSANGEGFVDSAGQQVDDAVVEAGARGVTRVEHDGELIAVLVHDPGLHVENPGFVEAVGSVAGLALQNERLSALVRAQLEEVRASRTRIVEAADEERRKIERDLHDGAQQRLVALAMRLEQARATATGSAALIDETTRELREALADVRALARGLYPPILTEAGLRAAVESLAERASLPVDIGLPDVRFPPAIEVTAYFVVAEALTNVDRYAAASEARVDGAVTGDTLTITVADDGRGGADPHRGTGLSGLSDRLAAIGGSLEIHSSAGQGTTVRAILPLPEPRDDEPL